MEKGILVYIPCHVDFDEAINQGKFLRRNFLALPDNQNQSLHLVLSVNAFSPSQSQQDIANEVFDQVIYYPKSFLADVNISQGFLVALQHNFELFWLLSANDKLVEGALTIEVTDMRLINGLISGVVYRTTRTREFFNTGPFFPWTGWSHLAVLVACLRGNNGLRIKAIKDEMFTQLNDQVSQNGLKYVHSFYGSLVQNVLFLENDRQIKKYLRGFIRQNFFLIHLFSQRDLVISHDMNLVDPSHYMRWNSVIAESKTPLNYIVYLIMKKIPFEKLQGFTIFQAIHKYITEKDQNR
jgi:hypothetical protein